MAYFITDSCISCGTCESECPVSEILRLNQAWNRISIDQLLSQLPRHARH